MRKIIGVDIDGTLLNSKGEISPKTKAALIKAQELGHKVVIVSGRDIQGVIRYADALRLKDFSGLLSNNNGVRVTNYKTGEIISQHFLDKKLLKPLFETMKTMPQETIFYIDGKIYTNKISPVIKHSSKINNMDIVLDPRLLDKTDYKLYNLILCSDYKEKLDLIEKTIREKFKDQFAFTRSTDYYFEIMPKGYSKGTSLVEIANYYKIDMKDVIAFGDERNDIEMIKTAGVGVAMENAVDYIKEISDYVTLSNDEDGIAYYLEKFVF